MSALSSLRAVDGVTASFCAELRALARPNQRFGAIILLRDLPVQYRIALQRQGAHELLDVGGEPALRLDHVEAWLADVRRAFHQADSAETVPRLTWLRRFAFAGIADGELGKREVAYAEANAEARGLGPLTTLVAQRLGLPVMPPTDGVKPVPASHIALPSDVVSRVLADEKVETFEIWQLADRARREGIDAQAALTDFAKHYGSELTTDARSALADYLAHGDRDTTHPQAPEALRKLWRDTKQDWDLSVLTPPARECSKEEMLERAKSIFTATNADGYRLSTEVKAFFDKYPSTGGHNLSAFFAGWAINETFGSLPLQAYNYTLAHPIDAQGRPRGPLWRAYVECVETGAPRDIIEEAYLRAHIADYKRSTLSPKFRQLYAISPKNYRKVVDAYVHTLRACEAQLDLGEKPLDVAKYYPLAVTRELVRRGSIGMVWTAASFRNGLNPRNPLTREWWGGFWRMLGTFFTNHHPKAAPADAIAVELSGKERDELSHALGIHITGNVIGKRQLEQATFAEPVRSPTFGHALPRYKVLLSDFTHIDPIHPASTYAGTDGVFQAREVLGVVRQAQARVRSNLIEEFAHKYPTPMNGLLTYSANMLALTGSYFQHEAYGMVPNFIMPVDNYGYPKTRYWQKFVDAYEAFKATGAPSKETLERYWFEAHMVDFAQVDSPAFRAKAEEFWRDAIKDPKLAPLATYFIAMVHGRQVFEQAAKERLPYEESLVRAFDHFRHTFVQSGGVPFLGEEAKNVAKLFATSLKPTPDFDERGLPTDRMLTKRMLEGLISTTGIAQTLVRGGVLQKRDADGNHVTIHTVADHMVDLRKVMPPRAYAKVAPEVRAFYDNPTKWSGVATLGYDAPKRFFGSAGQFVTKTIAELVTRNAAIVIGDQQPGPGKFAFEDDLLRERDGAVHWNRYVVGKNGHRKALFMAEFETQDGRIKETFSAAGLKVPLYFDVKPFNGGVTLSLDEQLSSKLVTPFAGIQFATTPNGQGGIDVRGAVKFKHLGGAESTFTATLYPADSGRKLGPLTALEQ